MIIKTKFAYEEQALIDFFYFHLKRKDKIRIIYYAIATTFFLIGLIVAFVFGKHWPGLIILVSSTIMFMLFSSQAKRAAKRAMKSRYKRDPQDIIFSDGKIEQHLESKILVYRWDLVLEVNETPKYIYYYISKQSALIVSKDSITEDEYNQLKELVKNKNKKYTIYTRI